MAFDLSELEVLVLNRDAGIDSTHGPIELEAVEFIDFLNSGYAENIRLNNDIPSRSEYYYHVAEYKGVEFLSRGFQKLYDVFAQEKKRVINRGDYFGVMPGRRDS